MPLTRIAGWLAYEPVRTYLYTVGVTALVVLNGYAVVSAEKAVLWGNLLAVVLVPAVERARSRVRPQFNTPNPHTLEEQS